MINMDMQHLKVVAVKGLVVLIRHLFLIYLKTSLAIFQMVLEVRVEDRLVVGATT